MIKYNYAIEIGGAFTKIYVKDCGLVLSEPTLVSAQPSARGYKILSRGANAKKLMGKTSEEIEVFSPISNGSIINYEYCYKLLEYFFEKIDYKKNSGNIIVLCGCGSTEKDKLDYLNLLHKIGFKEVAVVPTAVCACVGYGKNISSAKATMMVNIGGGNTDIAVINMNGIIKGATLGIGGRAIDAAISQAVAQNLNLVLGISSAENLKNEVGSLFINDSLNMEVNGIDSETKIPRSTIITSSDIYPIIEPYFDEILRAVDVTITSLPPEISTDIINSGVIFAGGVSLISGFENYLKHNFRYPFALAEDADNISIIGGGKLLDDPGLIQKIIENF